MRWSEIQHQKCSVARTLSVIGDRWTLMIIRDAFLRIRRFEHFQQSLGITRHSLSDRLKKLVDHGVFERVPYQQSPLRMEYRLTPKGRGLHPIIMTMLHWGDEWMDDGNGPPVLHRHTGCGQHFTPVLSCSSCEQPIQPRDVVPEAGPGLMNKQSKGTQS